MRRSPVRSGSGLARKRRHSINSSVRTRRPGANIKMSDHSMLGGARTGGEFHPAQFYSMPTNATKCGRCFFREGLVWLPAGRDLSHDRSAASRRAYRPRSLRALKSLEYGAATRAPWSSASASIAPSESNQWQQTHSWTSPWESIQRAVALSVVSTRMQELLLACRLRSNVIESALIVQPQKAYPFG
jgi:hypothetical protein